MRNETAIKVAKQISIKQRYSRVIFFFKSSFLAIENVTIKMIQWKYREKNRINPQIVDFRHYSFSDNKILNLEYIYI